ncbi:protein NDR1-like [Tasmannia lanceolata]|uniref:protein NDR1-like n=1 Tax=Tasmannia lanceolata TaxID=3420 RepID=UPI0040631193
MSLCGGCCRWCIAFNFSLGLTALFLWLSLRPSEPTLSIENFYVPALNKTASVNQTPTIPPQNTTIAFDLKLKNNNKQEGVYYDALNITIYYGQNRTSIGNVSIPGFYQGFQKTAHRNEEAVKADGESFWRVVLKDSGPVFRVGLETKVRYKIYYQKTKRHGLKLGGEVRVDEQGRKEEKKGVKLGSCAHVSYPAPILLILVIFLFVLIL